MIRVTIRGIDFAINGNSTPSVTELGGLYLVLKALEGDELAKEILDRLDKVIYDADRKQIYPPIEKGK